MPHPPWPCGCAAGSGARSRPTPTPPHAATQEAPERAFNLTPVGMCVTRERCIDICNDAFAHMFGHAQAELLGQPLVLLHRCTPHSTS